MIPDLDVPVAADPGRQATTGVVIDNPRASELVRTFPCHAAAGMIGRLEVRGA